MCGLAGWLQWSGIPNKIFIKEMISKLVHRGPDSGGVKLVGPIALGHRRLSVIDLSNAAAQPMTSGSATIVFNGELYNYIELKDYLITKGFRFKTKSDTEVVLNSFLFWGKKCVHRFNGMFAFAIWDNNSEALFIARDRLGEKPIYYLKNEQKGLIFSSELRSLLSHPWASNEIDLKGLSQYLSINYTMGDTSIIKNVKKLKPGHSLYYDKYSGLDISPYWDLADKFIHKNEAQSISDAAEELRGLIDDAVKIRMQSDVPLSAFLSGGIDSSTIAASMLKAGEGHEVRTYCMGFKEKSFNEAEAALKISECLGTSHNELYTEGATDELVSEALSAMDEPVADTSFIPTYYLCKKARKHETVCLTGDGGDEVFGGYETYVADYLHQSLQWMPHIAFDMAGYLLRMFPASRKKVGLNYKLKQFINGQKYVIDKAHYSWRRIFTEEEKRQVLKKELSDAVMLYDPYLDVYQYTEEVKCCHYLDRAMYVDLKTWLPDDILVKVDRASMANSLETRAPFLDHRIVEFCAQLPVHWKIKARDKKRVLKISQQNILPKKILSRSKRGFNAPVSEWLLSGANSYFRDLTASKKLHEYIEPKSINQLWKDHTNRVSDNGYKIFGLSCLANWLESNGVK